LISIIGSLAYYFYKINFAVFIITLLGLPLAIELRNVQTRHGASQSNKSEQKPKPMHWAAAAYFSIYIVAAAACFYLLIHHRTTDAIASPWHVLPHKFFIIFAVATAALVLFILTNNQRKFSLYLSILHTFLFTSVAFFIYKLGFGYDPFIHIATMRHIQQFGTIAPTLYYYVGEYSIILFLTNLFQVSLATINQLLLPILFSIYFPASIFFSFKNSSLVILSNAKNPSLLILAALFLPATFFINTTPQGLTCLLAMIIILISSVNKLSAAYNLILSITACFIHPFFGAPLLIYSFYCLGERINLQRTIKIVWRAVTIFTAAIIFPILFFLNQILNHKPFSIIANFPTVPAKIHAIIANSSSVIASLPAVMAGVARQSTFKKQFNFLYDLLYVYGFNYKIIFLIIVALCIILLWRKKQFSIVKNSLIFAALFGVNYFVIKTFFNFNFLTAKEAADYLGRISDLVFYFLLPTFLFGCSWLFTNILSRQPTRDRSFACHPELVSGSAFIVVLLTLTTTASLYITYPIFDNYKNSKFWSLGQSDIAAVQTINADAAACHSDPASAGEESLSCDYIVLSNQMVAAAALNEFGFKKYFGNEFYYSIPNANPDGFYKYFLTMMESDPTRAVAKEAMKAAGVNQLYFVADKYWRDADAIIEKAKTTANRWQSINDKVFIFYYTR
jgi:hypothetical protein